MPGPRAARAGSALQVLAAREQLRRAHPQRVGQAADVGEAGIALPALDAAEVRAVHPAAMSELLLREVAVDPVAPDRAAQGGVGAGALRHRGNVAASSL